MSGGTWLCDSVVNALRVVDSWMDIGYDELWLGNKEKEKEKENYNCKYKTVRKTYTGISIGFLERNFHPVWSGT